MFESWEKDWDNQDDAIYDEKPKVYMCTGCMRTGGRDNGIDYCNECQSYKYFEWVENPDNGD